VGGVIRARMPDLVTNDTASMIMNSYDDVRIDTLLISKALVASPGCERVITVVIDGRPMLANHFEQSPDSQVQVTIMVNSSTLALVSSAPSSHPCKVHAWSSRRAVAIASAGTWTRLKLHSLHCTV